MSDQRIEKVAIAIWEAYGNRASDWVYMAPEDERVKHCMITATAAVAAIDKAATIATVEELDALPIESVILDREGYPYRRVRQYPDVPSRWEGYELGEHLDVDTIDFPARVIHWGTE